MGRERGVAVLAGLSGLRGGSGYSLSMDRVISRFGDGGARKNALGR